MHTLTPLILRLLKAPLRILRRARTPRVPRVQRTEQVAAAPLTQQVGAVGGRADRD